ncbi:tripartite tricarboxylate transporter substrate binding protein [Ramlibacter sp. G-1-2-2]|uniref:Tripartite tricarboxylate transporter substrate binding protein n=1 Tax=Ramlibacter agri TaxID=2728837 RepID=A0A848HG15_9BURK|nr:tripartite tricarboxylate transporter substrate binding protein [Ramlibacter agri]NML46578.1 tripartite tricarboxylate transporter substrate binding protein [Ramlibacter agri]
MATSSSGLLRRAFAAGLLAACGLAHAAWPEHTITLVAPYPAGGAADVLSRLLAKKLEDEVHQTVIVDNKPGAGTAIGAGYVANAKPDGYTLLVSSNSTFTLNPALQAKLPYDAARGFDPIGIVGSVALAVLVNPSVAAQNVQQLVAAAKSNPDKFVYGSFGNGTSSNFAGAMFNAATGLKMMHVPYRGSAPLMTDLVGGQVPVSFDTVVAAAPMMQAGKVRVLAVTSARRSSLLPNVPTVAESGYPGFDMTAWIAVVAPKGLPVDVRGRLEKAFATMLASPELQERMKAAGFEPGWQPVPDWAGYVGSDIARMKAIAERAQIRLE